MPSMTDAPREIAARDSRSGGESTRRDSSKLRAIAVSAIAFYAAGIGVITGIIPTAFSEPELTPAATSILPSTSAAGAAMAGAGSVSEAALPEVPNQPFTVLKPIDSKTFGQPIEKGRARGNPAQLPSSGAAIQATNAQKPGPQPGDISERKSAATPAVSAEAEATRRDAPVRNARTACRGCGTVESIVADSRVGGGIGAGAVIGGLIGGVMGHQAGQGRGKDIATVAGAVGGAVIGHQIEKSRSRSTTAVARVRMDDGTFQTMRYERELDLRPGDVVRIENGRLIPG